jgi:hypothetical protein
MISFRSFLENKLQLQSDNISVKEILYNCKDPQAKKRIREIWSSGSWSEIIKYIPKNTKFKGAGREAILGLMPDGNVIKVTRIDPNIAYNPYLIKNEDQLVIGNYLIQIQKKALLPNKTSDSEWRSALVDLHGKMSSIPNSKIEDWGPDQIGKVGDEWKVLDSGVLKKRQV